jgi:hypothetical protein
MGREDGRGGPGRGGGRGAARVSRSVRTTGAGRTSVGTSSSSLSSSRFAVATSSGGLSSERTASFGVEVACSLVTSLGRGRGTFLAAMGARIQRACLRPGRCRSCLQCGRGLGWTRSPGESSGWARVAVAQCRAIRHAPHGRISIQADNRRSTSHHETARATLATPRASATAPAGTSTTAMPGSPPWTTIPPAKKPSGIRTSAASRHGDAIARSPVSGA